MINQKNPCESCIHQSKSWNDEPCYRCGSENDYAWCEKDNDNDNDSSVKLRLPLW